MLKAMKRISGTKVCKNYKILKLIFLIFGSCLILSEFYIFFVLKPTYTSKVHRKLNVEDFPEIILCPEPSINIEAAQSRGYVGEQEYFLGIWDHWAASLEQFGWAGNNSEDVKKVYDDISNVKTLEDCPNGINVFWYKDNETFQFPHVEFELTKALYPNHVCCKVVTPKFSQFYPLAGIQIASPNNGSFKLFMADQLTASYFDGQKTVMLGDKIVSGDNGIANYKVKIFEETRLEVEGDSQTRCIDYKIRGEYARCMENEILRQNSQFLNCTPPWMTYNEDLWCKGSFKLDSLSTVRNYAYFLAQISFSTVDPGTCSVPCRVKRYQAKNTGEKQGKYGFRGMYLWFETEVDSTTSSLKMDGLDLMSKIGGYIGISKNFLWVIIMFLSSVGVCLARFNDWK